MNELIKNKIRELFESTPKNIGVGFGKKFINNEFTGELGIIFTVPKKLPLEQLSEEEILPSSVEIDNIIYKTDVHEVKEIKTLVCDTLETCYGWQELLPENCNYTRPLQGGLQIFSYAETDNLYIRRAIGGTMGFIAIDTISSALVGVTNNHVVVQNPFFTTERESNRIENEIDNPQHNYGSIYQPDLNQSFPEYEIGRVIRYVPIYKSGYESGYSQVDGALVSLNSGDISLLTSYKQFGLSYSSPMEFATTGEIDNLLVSNPPLYSTGRTSGAKEGICGLIINTIGYTAGVSGYYDNFVSCSANFDNLITFTRINPDCQYPVAAGDSGSALIADFDGVCKIIGIVFAGSIDTGVACRIDELAYQLGISAWDGTTKPFIDLNSITTITEGSVSNSSSINCNGKIYWQMGNTNDINTCPNN
jgi:hypothetical protein